MKIASMTHFVALLVVSIAATPVSAQAPDTETNDATTASAKGPARTRHGADPAAVQINEGGIHVGGEEPVDINLPNWGSRIGPLIPIVSVLAVFGSPVAVLGLFFYFRYRRNRMLHETLRAMVEKGLPIPPELISGGATAVAGGPSAMRISHNDLRYGSILLALGAALLIVAGKFGLIPLFIGAAMIVVWLIGIKSRNNQAPK